MCPWPVAIHVLPGIYLRKLRCQSGNHCLSILPWPICIGLPPLPVYFLPHFLPGYITCRVYTYILAVFNPAPQINYGLWSDRANAVFGECMGTIKSFLSSYKRGWSTFQSCSRDDYYCMARSSIVMYGEIKKKLCSMNLCNQHVTHISDK